MGKQIAKLGIRPEDLKDKTVTSEQLELVVKRLGLIPALYDAL